MSVCSAGKACWRAHRDRWLFAVNTALLGWFFIGLSALDLNPSTSGLLLLALLCAVPTLQHAPEVWSSQRSWLLGLLLYGCFLIGYMALEGGDEFSRFDRPARFVAMTLVMLYLLRFGFSGRFLWLAVLLGTLVGTYTGLYEAFVEGAKRARGDFYPITFGYLMAALSLLCFFYARHEQQLAIRLTMLLAGIVGIIGAFSSGTRGVAVIFAAVAVAALVRWIWRKGIRMRWLAAGLLLVLGTLTVCYQVMPQVKRAVTQTQWELQQIQAGNLTTSFGQRLQMWSVALHLGSQHPVTGVGHDLEQIRSQSRAYIEERGFSQGALQYHHFHNAYIEAFAKRGFPGLAVFLLLMVAAPWGMKTHYRDAVLMILAVFVVGGLTEAVMTSGRLLYLLMVGVSVFRCLDYFEVRRQREMQAGSLVGGVAHA
ncbi:O-antigen ligase family protein [Marinobacterium marinum]|uniref:O-antigen ligase family protein n=1 Tax=Marinobacterium marinum TaxID=2756129 RepID=A0A7W1WWG5_9GAMM|nr:O-antigen ligase family protein [Marinobacterium marinum]MBA4501504.1 O-antigen ligase family protein [Marinobacterium marinum]